MRELAAQFAAEQQIVKLNQHDPLRQTDDADEEDRQENAAHDVSSERGVVLFCLRLAKRTRNQRGDDCRDRRQPVEPVVENSEGRRLTEAIDTDHRNQIAAITVHASDRDANSRRCCKSGGGAICRGAAELVFSRNFAILTDYQTAPRGAESIRFESAHENFGVSARPENRPDRSRRDLRKWRRRSP
jgi:hypothetical protein